MSRWTAQESDVAIAIQVYGTDWCRLTCVVREYLTRSRVDYDYFNIDQDATAHDFVVSMHDGRRRFPLVVSEERVLTDPTLADLEKLLDGTRARPRRRRR
jgi:glutaredoxin-related protein